MIDGIDIFSPRDSGLPDLSKLTPAQIFNGSAIASFNSMKEQHDPLGLLDRNRYDGTEEGTQKTTTIDPATGRRVEVRKATVVEELLNGKSARDRGHRKLSGRDSSGSYSVMGGPVEEPELPSTSPTDPSLLNVPGWHPPMAPDYVPPQEPDGNILLPQLDMSPAERRQASLRRLPTIVLEELRNLRMIS